mmetsp:Transcript_5607/g.14323  ORF Transcript_5607/g.14323 Transcript_5607/m.14323 type:complete len:113 (+) Transcript_5607:290-628(+)
MRYSAAAGQRTRRARRTGHAAHGVHCNWGGRSERRQATTAKGKECSVLALGASALVQLAALSAAERALSSFDMEWTRCRRAAAAFAKLWGWCHALHVRRRVASQHGLRSSTL